MVDLNCLANCDRVSLLRADILYQFLCSWLSRRSLWLSRKDSGRQRASGLDFLAPMQHVILPQASRAVVPALINPFVNLIMYTSVVSFLGILEFTRAGILVNNRELSYSLQLFGFVGLVYFAFCYLLLRYGRYLENRWSWAPKIGALQTAV